MSGHLLDLVITRVRSQLVKKIQVDKALASWLCKVISGLIHSDQNGFVKVRY